jgi:carboxypeptidase C (cathepsin A)
MTISADTTQSASAPEPATWTREFSGRFNRETISYRTVAGETYIRDEKGTPVASFFTTAYLRTGVQDAAQRPVAFIFNGGPGSSAQWLHLGMFGPKRVALPAEPKNAGAPPYALTDNEQCILDACDLVLIDPIGTGYSRTLDGAEPKKYWGLLEDARSVADFIQTWLTEQQRWSSPKYLIGESYGTTRAALVSEILSNRHIALNGVVMISAVLDFQNSRPRSGDGGILSYASYLPSYAAVAWYHGKIDRRGRNFEQFLDEVRLFARTEYAIALIANERLPREERTRVAARIADCTGLKQSYVDQSNLRIPVSRFFKELLRDQKLVVGRLDGRYVTTEPQSAGETCESDPSYDAIGSAFTSAINTYLGELGVRMNRPYVSARTPDSWNWLLGDKPLDGGGYVNVVPYLGRAMRRNEEMRVLVALGYYDLATPFFGAENALSQDTVVQERISYSYFEVGHMIFLHEPSCRRLLDEVRAFIVERGKRSSTQEQA